MEISLVLLAVVVATVLVVGACLLALLHAVQRIDDPLERSKWLLLFVLFHVFAAIIYSFTRYRDLRAEGKGALLTRKSMRESTLATSVHGTTKTDSAQ